MEQVDALLANLTFWMFFALFLVVGVIALAGLIYLIIQWYRYRNREEYSLGFVLLEIRVPRDNEIKIDAAEQMFASLYTLYSGGWQSHFKNQDHFSFEIVALKEDIRFYVSCPGKLQDLIEKQIHGAYPGAEIYQVDEYNIFSETGKVAFAAMELKNANYQPIKTYKELATDPLSSLTSALAKMSDGEGAVVQFILSPADKAWQHAGESYISSTKKREANPETAKYHVDQKNL